MKKLNLCMMMALTTMMAMANDSMWFTKGNQLVPLQSTGISVAKEVLTITLPEESDVQVDVYYEFYNSGGAQTVAMGFEADHPYMEETPSGNLKHPNISQFSVEVNGEQVAYKNKISRKKETYDDGGDHTYVYYFNAKFKPGKNIVRHSYTYDKSSGVSQNYWVDYKLTPAARWKGNCIGDFTLRVVAKGARHFVIVDNNTFVMTDCIISGTGKSRRLKNIDYDKKVSFFKELFLRNATAEWHITNFTPKEELCIQSGECMNWLSPYDGKNKLITNYISPERRYFYEDGASEWDKRVQRNLPYAAKGHVFKDPKLKKYFESFWWYTPER